MFLNVPVRASWYVWLRNNFMTTKTWVQCRCSWPQIMNNIMCIAHFLSLRKLNKQFYYLAPAQEHKSIRRLKSILVSRASYFVKRCGLNVLLPSYRRTLFITLLLYANYFSNETAVTYFDEDAGRIWQVRSFSDRACKVWSFADLLEGRLRLYGHR